jgi:hypothetical protein
MGSKRVEKEAWLWEIPVMETTKADNYKRVRLPSVKPGQVFAYADNGNGTITLTVVKADAKEAFPPDSQDMKDAAARLNREWAGVKLPVPSAKDLPD